MKTQFSNPSTLARSDSRQARLREDTYYRVLHILQNRPEVSQRELAKELGISLGAMNYCLRALIQKGQIKIDNFRKSSHKLGYAYILTPQGLMEKSRITRRFLERKILEFEYLKKEIDKLSREVLNETDHGSP